MVDADAQPLGGISGGRPHSEQVGNLLYIHGVEVGDRETVEIDPLRRRRPSHRLVSAPVVIEEPSGEADQLRRAMAAWRRKGSLADTIRITQEEKSIYAMVDGTIDSVAPVELPDGRIASLIARMKSSRQSG